MSLLLVGAGSAGTSSPAGPAFRNATTGTGSSGSTTVTLPTRVSGDTLVAFVITNDDSPPAAGTGWTRRHAQVGYDVISSLSVYTRQSNGTDNSPLALGPNSSWAYTLISVSDPAVGYDSSDVSVVSGMPDTSPIAPSVTATGSTDVLLSAYMGNSAFVTITPPGTQTGLTAVSTGSLTLRCAYETLSASGATGTRTATLSDMAGWATASVTVQ